MRGIRRALIVLAALAAVTAMAVAPAAGAGPEAGAAKVARPDLGLTKKSVVRLKSGRVTGSFVVRNSGRAKAKKFSAALSVKVATKYRVIKRFKLKALKRKKSRKVKVSVKLPSNLPAGKLPLRLCVDTSKTLKERSEKNNCRKVGTAKVTGGSSPATPFDSRPKNPVAFEKNKVFKLDNYWLTVPSGYDSSHNTPYTLFVWLHGCGGQSEGDITTISPTGDAQKYIAIAVDGREGGCWDVTADPAAVMGAIGAVKSHFNINPRRVIIGGYSSGGDLAYKTAFYNAKTFAGVLAENTSPFRDTGSSQQASLAAAAYKFHVVHLAHTEDDTYGIAGVRQEVGALKSAGFPAELIERPGNHYDDSTDTTGTDHDLKTLLLPHIDDGWLAP